MNLGWKLLAVIVFGLAVALVIVGLTSKPSGEPWCFEDSMALPPRSYCYNGTTNP